MNHTGPWHLSDLDKVKPNGCRVFSCFAGGGGSSMGYKLAGYDVVGAIEIDKTSAKKYRMNLNPKNLFECDIVEFNDMGREVHEPFIGIDILDGSPPCSTFSMAGKREQVWGKKKKFREGQKSQVLDDLFFHYLITVERLQPKVVVAENVKGLIIGNAKWYVKKILERFKDLGYRCQLFLLDASKMGVPQRRERVFFIATKLQVPKLNLSFDEKIINIKQALTGLPIVKTRDLTDYSYSLWNKCKYGQSYSKHDAKGNGFAYVRLDPEKPCPTIISKADKMHWFYPRKLTLNETIRCSSFPDDYKEISRYVMGMSVPPFMIERIANEIYLQWLR